MAKYKAADVAEALQDALGNVSLAATRLGCTRQTVYNYINKYTTVKQAHEESREVAIDHVESKLMQAINEGNVTAMIFYLKTQAKERGYTERTQHEHTGNLQLTMSDVLTIDDDDDADPFA